MTGRASLDVELEALGLQPGDKSILLFVPMVTIAWADGKADMEELQKIAKSQRKVWDQGVTCKVSLSSRGKAFLRNHLLHTRPEAEKMDLLVDLLLVYLDSVTARNESDRLRDYITSTCIEVARASGGLLGLLDRVGKPERKRIEELMRRLNLRDSKIAREQLREIGL